MKTKPADVPYCGVRKEVIKKASPTFNEDILKYHHNYIFERHKIYKKKEIEKLPPSWTEDEIFQKYKFTNVRRELDRESKWLIRNISKNENLSFEEKILWSILFRAWNKSETFRILNFPEEFNILTFNEKDIDKIRNVVEEFSKANPKYVWYTSAFNMGGIKHTWRFPKIYEYKDGKTVKNLVKHNGKEMTVREAFDKIKDSEKISEFEPNMVVRMLWLVKFARDDLNIANLVNEASSQKDAYEKLLLIPGFSEFLAYQVFVDFTYIEEFKFSENEFTVAGPGCQGGIDYMFKDKDGMTYEECIFWVRDYIEKEWKKRGWETDLNKLFDHLPEYDRCLNVMMLENSFCELSKYTKAKKEMGRPRAKYDYSKINACSLKEW